MNVRGQKCGAVHIMGPLVAVRMNNLQPHIILVMRPGDVMLSERQIPRGFPCNILFYQNLTELICAVKNQDKGRLSDSVG